ncbi:hypothetical protein CAQU_02415 [Corynebacterium aquilae DSM 44791]|uniref:YdbS-like PH domain-containing protein n=2 Tax=Corynebacterium aquilae TaxID=203263 RepID=A0A1L7CEB6_9CORY|nr:hypothetical protein CAQU_02415 [Corynebacterium aquilae DSM 44791]
MTPLVKFWSALLGFFLVVSVNFLQNAADLLRRLAGDDTHAALMDALYAVIALVVFSVAVWLLSGLWWRAYGYKLDGQELSLRNGVIAKNLRTARYSRIQAVDVVEDFWPRLLGLAAVRVETAGGRNSALAIEFLGKKDALALRDEIMGIVHGTDPHPPEGHSDQPLRPADLGWVPEDSLEPVGAGSIVVPEIPIMRSFGAALLSVGTWIAVAFAVFAGNIGVGLAALIPLAIGLASFSLRVLNASWRYRAVRRGRVLTIEYGLLDRRSQNIAMDRIHGIKIHQPLLWRLVGWCQLQVSVAGYGHSKDGSSTKILPVGTLDQAHELLVQLGPLSAAEVQAHARVGVVDASGMRPPARVRWCDPLAQRRESATLIGMRAFITHQGFFVPSVCVIAPRHIQELTLHSGPVDRALGVCSLTCDLVGGPVKMTANHLQTADAEELLAQLRARKLPPPDKINAPIQ